MKGGHGPTKYLQDLNWGAFDHASHAPNVCMTMCVHCVCTCMCIYVFVCVCVCVCV